MLLDRTALRGYLNAAQLGNSNSIDLLTPDGEHQDVPIQQIRSVSFVREFTDSFEPDRKVFMSRPKLDGLWVRLKFRDNDETIEGVVPNDLLALLDQGVLITPPDFQGSTLHMFIPRTALAEMSVLGVIGIARRKLSPPPVAQPKLFSE